MSESSHFSGVGEGEWMDVTLWGHTCHGCVCACL